MPGSLGALHTLTHLILRRKILLSSWHRGGDWSSENLNNLPQFTQLMKVGLDLDISLIASPSTGRRNGKSYSKRYLVVSKSAFLGSFVALNPGYIHSPFCSPRAQTGLTEKIEGPASLSLSPSSAHCTRDGDVLWGRVSGWGRKIDSFPRIDTYLLIQW